MAASASLDLIIGVKDRASGPLGKIGGALSSIGKIGGAAFLGGAIAGVGLLGAALVGGIADARAANIVLAQTEAVLKSTGGASGKTAVQISELAASLSAASGKSLFGDDLIQQSSNLLLTFTNIRGPIVDAATAISVDMAQALGGAPADAAVQLGKALNDPIAGISALSRVGVTFSEDQKKVIAGMVETGNVAGAQTIILDELNKEFGGSAAAAAAADGGFTQFKDSMGELAESIGAKVLPALSGLMGWLNSPAVQAGIQGLVDGLVNGVTKIGEVISSVTAAFQTGGLAGVFDLILPQLQAFGTGVLTWIQTQAPIWGAQILTWGAAFVGWVAPYIPIVLAKLGELAASVGTWLIEQAPAFLAQMGTWAVQFTAWVLPLIPQMLGELGNVATAILTWIGEQVASIGATANTWAPELTNWIQEVAVPALVPAFAEFDAELGAQFSGIMDRLITTTTEKTRQFAAAFVAELAATPAKIIPELDRWSATIFTWLDATAESLPARTQRMTDAFLTTWRDKQAEWLPTLDRWSVDLEVWADDLTYRAAIKGGVMANEFLGAIGEAMIAGTAIVTTAISGVVDAVVATATGYVTQFVVVGSDIVAGIASGIAIGAVKVAAAAISAVTGALQAAKDAIWSKSPSKKFADEVGKPMMDGVIVGIDDNKGRVNQAARTAMIESVNAATEAVHKGRPQLHQATKALVTDTLMEWQRLRDAQWAAMSSPFVPTLTGGLQLNQLDGVNNWAKASAKEFKATFTGELDQHGLDGMDVFGGKHQLDGVNNWAKVAAKEFSYAFTSGLAENLTMLDPLSAAATGALKHGSIAGGQYAKEFSYAFTSGLAENLTNLEPFANAAKGQSGLTGGAKIAGMASLDGIFSEATLVGDTVLEGVRTTLDAAATLAGSQGELTGWSFVTGWGNELTRLQPLSFETVTDYMQSVRQFGFAPAYKAGEDQSYLAGLATITSMGNGLVADLSPLTNAGAAMAQALLAGYGTPTLPAPSYSGASIPAGVNGNYGTTSTTNAPVTVNFNAPVTSQQQATDGVLEAMRQVGL